MYTLGPFTFHLLVLDLSVYLSLFYPSPPHYSPPFPLLPFASCLSLPVLSVPHTRPRWSVFPLVTLRTFSTCAPLLSTFPPHPVFPFPPPPFLLTLTLLGEHYLRKYSAMSVCYIPCTLSVFNKPLRKAHRRKFGKK